VSAIPVGRRNLPNLQAEVLAGAADGQSR